jgi:GNAT superfamily N-acetyltransferase
MSPVSQLTVRPVREDDRAALAAAFERLSDESRRRRFLAPKPRLTSRELARLTEVDHVSHEALVAVAPDGAIVAEARYAAWPDRPCVADFAVTVADEWQGRGVGSALARQVLDTARRNGMRALTGSTLWENAPARSLLARLGFRAAGSAGGVLDFELRLAPAAAAA